MIQLQQLQFGYSKRSALFNNLDLQLSENNIVGLLGKNGAGKTSLLKLLAGLRYPTSGNISVNGFVPKNRKPEFLQNVFFLAEEFYTPTIQLQHYITAYSRFYPSFDFALLNQLLETFEISTQMKFHKLSYGQKKKFLIAFALATKCRILVFDEPTNGLDIPSKAIFRKILAGSLSENQLVIISTHQVRDVVNLLDRVVIIDQGKIKYNAHLADVAEQYSFKMVTHCNSNGYIYFEQAPGGFNVIEKNTGTQSVVDIELLFNAVINEKMIAHENK